MFTRAKRWLKKHFIPHEDNDYQPHILRREATTFILAVILLVEAYFLAQTIFFSKTNLSAIILQNVLVDETNSNRQSDGLLTLKESPLLDVAAEMKAEDMATKGYFAHVSPEGLTPWYWFEKVGYNYVYAGENLAINFTDSSDVINAWLNSPAHRQNILNQNFTDIGIGIATGAYGGKSTTFIVQMFGEPLISTKPTAGKPVALANLKTVESFSATTTTGSTGVFTAIAGASGSAIVGGNTQGGYTNETSPVSALTWRMVASPRATTNYIYAILMVIVSLALLLSIVIKIRVQHPGLILNGIIMLVMINAVLILNSYLALANTAIF